MNNREMKLAQFTTRHLLRDTSFIFLFSLLLFTIALQHQEFINFESRFALFAQDMWRFGIGFFPTIYGHPYPDYPATSTLLIYLCSLPFGEVTRFSAILPSAIFSALTLSFIYLIAAPHSRKWGFCAVLFTLITVFFFSAARSISLDQYTTMITTFCFYCAYAQKTYEHRRLIYWIVPALILGFLFRGPIGLIIPAGVVSGYYLAAGRIRSLLIFALIAGILLSILSLLFLAAAEHTGGAHFVRQVMMMEVSGRLNPSDTASFDFYFRHVWGDYALSFPFAVLVVLGHFRELLFKSTDKRIQLIRYLIVWILVILIGMSIPGGKKMRYIAAITPASALIAAYLFIALQPVFWLRAVRFGVTWLFFLFPFIGAVITLLARNYAYHRGLHLHIDYTKVFIWLAFLQIVVLFYALIAHGRHRKEVIALLVATLGFVGIHILIVEPAEQRLNAARAFVLYTEALRTAHPGALYFYRLTPDGAAIKYFVNSPDITQAHYVYTEKKLLQLPTTAYIIIENDDYLDLHADVRDQFNVLFTGNFGRDNALVLQRKK